MSIKIFWKKIIFKKAKIFIWSKKDFWMHTLIKVHIHKYFTLLSLSYTMLENGQTYFQNLVVQTIKHFQSMFSHLSKLRIKRLISGDSKKSYVLTQYINDL